MVPDIGDCGLGVLYCLPAKMRLWKGGVFIPRPTVGLSTTQWQTPGLRRHWGSVALCSGPLRSHPSERGPQARAEGIVKSFPHCQQLLGSSGMWLRVTTRRVLAEPCPSRSPLEDDPSYSLLLFLQYEHGRGCQSHADSWKAKRRFESFFRVYGQFPHTFPHPCKALVASFSCSSFVCFFLERVTLRAVWGCTTGLQSLGTQES